MEMQMVKITVYINETDQWQQKPLHLEVLQMLLDNNLSGGTVLQAAAGFTNNGIVDKVTSDPNNRKLPLVIEFVDTAQKIENILPELKRMVGTRLILRESVEVVI
jgi:PII-like signaling protein